MSDISRDMGPFWCIVDYDSHFKVVDHIHAVVVFFHLYVVVGLRYVVVGLFYVVVGYLYVVRTQLLRCIKTAFY